MDYCLQLSACLLHIWLSTLRNFGMPNMSSKSTQHLPWPKTLAKRWWVSCPVKYEQVNQVTQNSNISVQNNDLCPTNEVKVLGVTLDDILNFKSHVDDICNRASRQINSIKRFSKYLKIDRRLSVYKSFIQSNYSYWPVARLFCGGKNNNRLEKLQERAIRIVFDDFSSSYEFLCERANTLPLSFYRFHFLGIGVYKCIKETNPTYLND